MINQLLFILGVVVCLWSCNLSEQNLLKDRERIPLPELGSDIKDDINVPVLSATASSFQKGQEIEKAFDGDVNTLYHSAWNQTSFPVELTFNFDGSQDIDYFVYHPRSSGSNGNIEEVEVWVKNQTNSFSRLSAINFQGQSSSSAFVFDESLKAPKAIKLVINSGKNGFVSCAEMQFYQKDTTGFDVLSLFSDLSCSTLRTDIKLDDIENSPSAFFKEIALSMWKGDYPGEFRIQEYKAYQHPSVVARQNKTNGYSLLENVTGIAVEAGDTLLALVDDTYSTPVTIKIQNLGKDGAYYSGSSYYALVKGVNKVVAKNKGLIYVLYHPENWETAPPVKIHFATGTVNGYWDISKHNQEDWKRLIATASNQLFDVVGRRSHLTFATERFKSYTADPKALVEVYDSIISIEEDFMGLSKYDRQFNNKLYFHVNWNGGMSAPNNHIVINDSYSSKVLDPEKLKTVGIWGPAHEVGHLNQTRPGFKWHGMTEMTNNLHSIYVQTYFGNRSRFMYDNSSLVKDYDYCWYELGWSQFFPNQIAHNSLDNQSWRRVLAQTIPFWQLYLYFVEVEGQTELYKDFYEAVRNDKDPATDGACQLEFVRKMCRLSGTNLLPFFQKWGFLTPIDQDVVDYSTKRFTITQSQVNALKEEIQAAGYQQLEAAMWYITDENKDVFKKQSPIIKGTASLSENTFTMTNWGNVAAYEVYTNGKLVFASPLNEFTVYDALVDESTVVYAVASNGEAVKVDWHKLNN